MGSYYKILNDIIIRKIHRGRNDKFGIKDFYYEIAHRSSEKGD